MNKTAAITLEALSEFCSPEKRGMTRPWRRAKHSFASDGHVLVRVPALDGCYTGVKAPNERLVNDVLAAFPKAAKWTLMPTLLKSAGSVAIGAGNFRAEYLEKIEKLPSVRVATVRLEILQPGGKRTVTALAFKFAGDGIGFLLPLVPAPEDAQ